MRRFIQAAVASAAAFVCLFVHAQDDRPESRAGFQLSQNRITFSPQVPFAELELTVAGAGVHWQRRSGSASSVSFTLSDADLSDGLYRYELIASPAYDEAAWEAAEGDAEALQALEAEERAQSFRLAGRFRVVDGELKTLRREEDERAEMRSEQNWGIDR